MILESIYQKDIRNLYVNASTTKFQNNMKQKLLWYNGGKKIMILFGDLVSLTPAQSLIRLLSFLL